MSVSPEVFLCTKDRPWDGRPRYLVLHPDAQLTVYGERVCPNCGFRWVPDPTEPPDEVP